MIPSGAHLLTLVGACLGLLVWGRRLAREPIVGRLVATGGAIRAVLGPLVVAASYYAWPVARSAQAGRGFWFFAADGAVYYDVAAEAASRGGRAILQITTLTSVAFVKALSFAIWVFGATPLAAIVLNLVSYFALCEVLIAWRGYTNGSARTVQFAVAVLSFSPTLILWSLQPLKETLLVALAVAFLFSTLVALDGLDASTRRDRMRRIGAALAAAVLLYVLSGMRWFYALALLAATCVAAVIKAAQPWRRPVARGAMIIGGCLVLSQVVAWGSGMQLPAWGRALLRPAAPSSASPAAVLRGAVATMNDVRDSILTAGGSTGIHLAARMPTPPVAETSTSRQPSASEGGPVVPRTAWDRVRTGTAAMFVPRWVAEPLGLFQAAGGRGLWLFAELDTVAFDIALIGMVLLIRHEAQAGRRLHPVASLIALTTMALVIALAFTVPNYGSLIRYRAMVLVGIAVLPLTLVSRQPMVPD